MLLWRIAKLTNDVRGGRRVGLAHVRPNDKGGACSGSPQYWTTDSRFIATRVNGTVFNSIQFNLDFTDRVSDNSNRGENNR